MGRLAVAIAPQHHYTSNVALLQQVSAPTQFSYAPLDAGDPIFLPPSYVYVLQKTLISSPSPAPSLPLSGSSTAPAIPKIALVAGATVAGVVSLAVAATVISVVASKMGIALLPSAWSLLSSFTGKLQSLPSLSRFKFNGGDPADQEGNYGVYDRRQFRAVRDTLVKEGEEIISAEYESSIENLTKMSKYEASKFLKKHGVIVPELEEVCAKRPVIEKIDDDPSITTVKDLAVSTLHISDEGDADAVSATISSTVESTTNMDALKSKMAMSDKGVVITDGGSYPVTSGSMLSSTSEQALVVARPHAAGTMNTMVRRARKRASMTQEPISSSSADLTLGVAKRPTSIGHVSISCEFSVHRLRYYFLCNSGTTYGNHNMGSTHMTQFYHPQQQQHSNMPYASDSTSDSNAMILDMNQLYNPQQQSLPWPLSHKTQDPGTPHNPTHNNPQDDGPKPTSQQTPPHGLLSRENPIQEYDSPFYGV